MQSHRIVAHPLGMPWHGPASRGGAALPNSGGDRGGAIATTSDTARTVTGTWGTRGDGYKWVALSNTTVGVMLATIDSSIMLIAMPDIFRGIGLNPLDPANSFYLLWMILGFLIVSSVLVVRLGRLGDIVGRVRSTTSASSSTPGRRCCSRSTG